jgi:septal ring factor EnvC (AmiA/AmiB activator)
MMIYPFLVGISFATEPKLNQVQNNLKKIEYKISKIKQDIHVKQKTHQQIQQVISKQDQEIQKTLTQKLTLNKKINILQVEIQRIELALRQSKRKMISYQKNIYNHLNLHLQLAEETYWQIIFSAQNPFDYHQRLDLYQYLYRSEQKTLEQIKEEKAQLTLNQNNLTDNISSLNNLKQQLEVKELTIREEKNKQTQKLNQVDTELAKNHEELKNIQKNQAQLKVLVQSLLKENQLRSNRPFTVMKNKLNYPISSPNPSITKIQNGVMFKAPENTSVHAVSSGKVVFADWLNGYGYLVIIDHGWGFMSLYGNNQTLLKHKGDYVHQADSIATVGHSGAFHQTGLYFEIRQRAHVVSAMNWFQKRTA